MTVTERVNGDVPIRSVDEAAALLADDATLLISGFGSVGYPKVVPLQLADSGRNLSLTVVSGGSVGEEVDSTLAETGAIERRFPYQARSEMRAAINDGEVAFQDRNVSDIGDEVRYGGLADEATAIVEAVAVGEDWLIPSMSIGTTPSFVAAADRLVVEVNHEQPLELQNVHDSLVQEPPPERGVIPLEHAGDRIGSSRIEFDREKLEAVVHSTRRGTPYSFREPTDADTAISGHIARFLEEEIERTPVFERQVHLQFGVGSLGNALMNALDRIPTGNRELVYFGEVIQDGLLDMLEDGTVKSASASSLALSEEGQDQFFADIETFAKNTVLRPSDISNSPALINRFGVVAVNSALEVDIYGHVNSTHINGTRIMNGVGGSGDFSRNALVSIIALPSTAADGDISRIVPMVPHVDHTEHDIDVVITERGVADLRGLSPRERSDVMIENCAHPDFSGELREYVDRAGGRGGHVPHDLETAFSTYVDRQSE